MTKSNDKSGSRLSKTKKANPQQNQQFKTTLSEKLFKFDDELSNLLKRQAFLQQSILSLSADDSNPEFWLTGAILTHQHLRESGERLMGEFENTREWVKKGVR